MEYYWDIKKITKQKNAIQELINNNQSLKEEEIENLEIELEEIEDLESALFPDKKTSSFLEEKYMDENHQLPLANYNNYLGIPTDIRNIILGSIDCFKNYYDTYDSIELPQLNLSDQELVDMSDNFFQWLSNKNYLKLYRKYTNPSNHLLQFFPLSDSFIRGITSFLYYPTYTPYFSIYRDHTIEDFHTLNHEIAHGIYSVNDFYSIQPPYYLKEVEGHFFNYLSGKYLINKIDNRIIRTIEYLDWITQFDNIIIMYVFQLSIQLIENKKEITGDSIQRLLKRNKLTIIANDDILEQSLLEDPMVTANSSLSYLTSLDLEAIYEQDPEYAFYLLEGIRNNKTNDIFSNLRENKITFMDDGYQNLQKKMKTFGKFIL